VEWIDEKTVVQLVSEKFCCGCMMPGTKKTTRRGRHPAADGRVTDLDESSTSDTLALPSSTLSVSFLQSTDVNASVKYLRETPTKQKERTGPDIAEFPARRLTIQPNACLSMEASTRALPMLCRCTQRRAQVCRSVWCFLQTAVRKSVSLYSLDPRMCPSDIPSTCYWSGAARLFHHQDIPR